MAVSAEELVTAVVGHLREIRGGACSITQDRVERTDDRAMAEMLGGLLDLHRELLRRESERSRSEAELNAVVERLEAQNKELEVGRASLAALAAELSTPVIRVWEGIIMLPLVGTVDAARGSEITERLLTAVVDEKASHAII